MGGTWLQDTIGYVLVGSTQDDPIKGDDAKPLYLKAGKTTGSANTTVNFNHTHAQTHIFKSSYSNNTGLKYMEGESAVDSVVATQPSDWSTMTGASTPVKSSKITLGDKTWSNVQPSIGVVRWHRTA